MVKPEQLFFFFTHTELLGRRLKLFATQWSDFDLAKFLKFIYDHQNYAKQSRVRTVLYFLEKF